MKTLSKFLWQIFAIAILMLSASAQAQGQDTNLHFVVRNLTEIDFMKFPGMPTGAPGFVQTGNPAKGPSILIGKVEAGCTIPWHWHTPNEHLMIVSGVVTVQMKGENPITLKEGGFAIIPSHYIHQFHCIEDCVLYVYSDAAFDLHYVDGEGKEIPPVEALKLVNETTVQENK